MNLRGITDALVGDLGDLAFGSPVTHVYNPLVYARKPWDRYCERFGEGRREVLCLGMNPGPFGMGQVGIPFGEVNLVRGWLGIEAEVGKPPVEHPKRPIEGFGCKRSEVSGARLWGWARDTYGTPDAFFARFFVANYCPLLFMGESGANITPDRLSRAEQAPLFAACDRALLRTIEHLGPRVIIGVGKFAEQKARAIAGELGVAVAGVAHPSPASPVANRGWAPLMTAAVRGAGVEVPG